MRKYYVKLNDSSSYRRDIENINIGDGFMTRGLGYHIGSDCTGNFYIVVEKTDDTVSCNYYGKIWKFNLKTSMPISPTHSDALGWWLKREELKELDEKIYDSYSIGHYNGKWSNYEEFNKLVK